MKNQITIEQGQDLRKKGMYLVTNKSMDKVICVTPDYDLAIKKSKNNKIWYPLTKMNWTKADTKKALQELALGLQCNI
jgi:hypothetical protein